MMGKKAPDIGKDGASVKVISVSGAMEEMLVEGILNGAEIPFVRDRRGISSSLFIITGSSVVESAYYVSPKDLDKAKQLLEAYLSEPEDEIEE